MAARALPRRHRLGATAVEFALVAQMFFFVILGCFDLVGMMNAYSTLQWSVATAARTVMSNPSATTAQVQAAAQAAANSAGYTGSSFVVNSATCGSTSCMTITGSYSYRFIVSKAFCRDAGTGCSISLSKSLVAPVGPTS